MIDLNKAGEQLRPQPAAQRELDQRPRIESALAVLDPDCDRDTWVRIGQAIQNELGEDGFSIWDEWSRAGSSYRETSTRETWRSFGQGRGITAGTLFRLAQEYGWSDTVPAREMTPEDVEVRRRSKEKAARKNEAEAERVQAQARAWSAAIIAAAEPARPDHPYLVRKGVYPAQTMLEIDATELQRILGYSPQANGEPLTGRVLAIPLERFDGTGPCTVELIDESGRKSALAGPGTKTGAHGRLDGFQGVPDVVLVGEGAATTLTALEALRGHNAAAFMASSASNMPSVARAIRAQYPVARIIILADLEKATGEPNQKAVEASRAVDGFLAVPDFGPGWTAAMGTDFNDLASAPAHGLDAVYRCIERASLPVASRFEFLDRDDLMNLPDTEYFIKPLFPSRGVIAIHGPSGTSKSFLALDQAGCVAEGRSWFGFRVKRRLVAILVLEGMGGFKRRIQAWEKFHGRRWPRSIKIIPRPKTGFDLRNEKDVADLAADLKLRLEPGTILYVDTLAQAMPGSEETNADYGLALAAGERIGNAIEGAVVLLAHPGKDATKGIRGGYNLFCGLDANMELVPVPGEDDLVTWTMRKSKDSEAGIERRFRRVVVDLGVDSEGDPVSSCAIEPVEADTGDSSARVKTMTKSNRERFEAFRQAAMERGFLDDSGAFIGIDKDNWREHFYEHSKRKTPDATRTAFGEAIRELKRIELIYESADGLFRFDGPGAETQAAIIGEAIRARRGLSE